MIPARTGRGYVKTEKLNGSVNRKLEEGTMPAKKTTAPAAATFDKELFKRSVLYNVRTLYRKTMEEATPQQIFQAVAYAVKDQIVENWMETQKQ